MRTAQEMYSYCTDNGLGSGFNKKWGLKHFGVVESNLMDGEEVKTVFIGLHNYESSTKHDSYYAYAVTNKRLIAGQKKLIGENTSMLNLKNINDMQLSTGALMGVVTFDTLKETLRVAVSKKEAKAIFNSLQESVEV